MTEQRAPESNENVFDKLVTTARHVVIYGLGIILTRSLGFVLIPLYTSYLSPADYGVLEILYRVADLVNIILATGLGVTIIRFYTLEKDPTDKDAVITTGITYTVVLGGLVVGLLFWQAEWLTSLMYNSTEHRQLVIIMLFFCLAETLFIIPMAFIQAQVKSTQFVIFSLVKFVLGISLNIYMVAGLEFGVKGIMVANLIAGAVASGAVIIWSVRRIGFRVRTHLMSKMLKFSLPLIPGGMLLFIINSGDRFFLQRLTNDTVLGIYSLGYKLGSVIAIMVLAPFNKIWAVYVFKIAQRPDHRMLFPMIFRLLMFAYAFLGLALSLFGQDLVVMFATEGYHEAYKIIPYVVLSYLLWTASTFFDLGFYISGKTAYKSFIVVAGAAVILPLYWYLIPRYDMYGAVWATVGGFTVFTLVALFLSRRVYPINYGLGRFGQLIALGVLFYLAGSYSVGMHVGLSIVYRLGLLLIFPVALYFTAYLTQPERELIANLLSVARDKVRSFRSSRR